MMLKWNFLGGGGVQNKGPFVGWVWIFCGTAQWEALGEVYLEDAHHMDVNFLVTSLI